MTPENATQLLIIGAWILDKVIMFYIVKKAAH